MTVPAALTVRTPVDLLAVVPYALGFHPRDSVVAVAVRHGRLAFAARLDAGDPAGNGARQLAGALVRERATMVAIIGYGAAPTVTPLVRAVRAVVTAHGVAVGCVLRVAGGRYFSDDCDDPGCCPAEGTPFDPTVSEIAATCTYLGVSALPDRESLAAGLAPVDGAARVAMRQATERADQALTTALAEQPVSRRPGWLVMQGSAAVRSAIARYRERSGPAGDASAGAAVGTRSPADPLLSDDEVARLGLLLGSLPVRDRAWEAITRPHPHRALWTDVLRRVEPRLAAAPASLLAFAAWCGGDGVLAAIAVERALQADPVYSMARLIDEALRHGLPPSVLRGWGGRRRRRC